MQMEADEHQRGVSVVVSRPVDEPDGTGTVVSNWRGGLVTQARLDESLPGKG